MDVLDPGHKYLLKALDDPENCAEQILYFVKRKGDKYPGNKDAYGGTTTQEVLRALIDRAIYVNQQQPCPETTATIGLFRTAIYLLESRAKRVHGETLDVPLYNIEIEITCLTCGHIRCTKHAN